MVHQEDIRIQQTIEALTQVEADLHNVMAKEIHQTAETLEAAVVTRRRLVRKEHTPKYAVCAMTTSPTRGCWSAITRFV